MSYLDTRTTSELNMWLDNNAKRFEEAAGLLEARYAVTKHLEARKGEAKTNDAMRIWRSDACSLLPKLVKTTWELVRQTSGPLSKKLIQPIILMDDLEKAMRLGDDAEVCRLVVEAVRVIKEMK